MVWQYVTPIFGSLLALLLVVLYFAEPADEALAAEVILGDRRDDDGWLPPAFVDFTGATNAPQDTLAAIQEANRTGASGIKLYLDIVANGVGVLFHDRNQLERTAKRQGMLEAAKDPNRLPANDAGKESSAARFQGKHVPTLEEGIDACLRLGLRVIVDVQEHDAHSLIHLIELFHGRPEIFRRVLVASPSPMFLARLRGGRNATIVTALTWPIGSYAYEDAQNTKRRYDKLVWHLTAKAADWLLEWSFECGLLTRLTMVSAVLVNASVISPQYVGSCSGRGLGVIALASNDWAEHEYLRRIVRVPIVTDNLRRA
ncbi:glycerophosphodiester phosphodiesterase 1-like [Dermacentor albipictus]|uniref:glycerophosphodiester phosphodiesterase 1-like n=1 Tax=Dermacentor albipictus TaxID=60249 RepID=UPI0031FD82AE